MPETPKTTLRIPRALMDRVKVKAAREGTTVTAIVTTALTEYAPEDTDPEPTDRSRPRG